MALFTWEGTLISGIVAWVGGSLSSRFAVEGYLLSCSVPLISVATRFELMYAERVGR